MVYYKEGKIQVEYGNEVEILQEKIIQSTLSDKIVGSIACPGKAMGKVRLIEPHVLNQEFHEGEILVTKMTTPDLMPLIKKASAIVTDEGGITCHAAIVSREFKIPCIIGTKTATQILKNGDLIEVDAEKGELKKLK
ncbi:PEP-utilizing enzyme [Nanoarchaeota archaeon]